MYDYEAFESLDRESTRFISPHRYLSPYSRLGRRLLSPRRSRRRRRLRITVVRVPVLVVGWDAALGVGAEDAPRLHDEDPVRGEAVHAVLDRLPFRRLLAWREKKDIQYHVIETILW